MDQALKTLPGVYFETVSPRPPQALPRMDIAAFVGFAQKGPLHTPVPVEDSARFREIFGDDIPLAWDGDTGTYQYSYLGASISTFFRNGGRRCWVVRVADESAITHSFRLPGLLCVGGDGVIDIAAHVSARSPGSWAQLLRVGTVLQVTQLYPDLAGGEDVLVLDAGGWMLRLTALSMPSHPGELLELRFDDTEARLFLSVSAIESGTAQGVVLKGDIGYWLYPDDLPSPPAGGAIETEGLRIYPIDRTADLGHPVSWNSSGPNGYRPRVRLLRFELQAWLSGVLQQRLPGLAFHPRHPRFWGHLPSDGTLFASSEGTLSKIIDDETQRMIADASRPRFPLAAAENLLAADAPLRNGVILPAAMGFTTGIDHTVAARSGLPTSEAQQDGLGVFASGLFLDDDLATVNTAALMGEAENLAYVRNPAKKLRGIHSLIANQEITMLSVPDAAHRRWDREPPERKPGLPAPWLKKINASTNARSLFLEWEVVAGVSSYWLQRDTSPDFSHPVQTEIRAEDLLTAGETPAQLPVPPSQCETVLPAGCPDTFYFRVRAERLGEISPWSNTRARLMPVTSFARCGNTQPQLLEIRLAEPLPGSPPDSCNLSWQPAGEPSVAADRYRLQASPDLEFASITDDIELDSAVYAYRNETEGLLYVRVRAYKSDIAGPWSNVITIEPVTLKQLTLQQVDRFSDRDLIDVHRSILRFCAARADILAVLTLPRHYKTQQAIDHVAKLKPPGTRQVNTAAIPGPVVPPLNAGESHALSFAAIYHPWVVVAPSDQASQKGLIRAIPVDGIAAGSMARVAADHGAWIAPANDLFSDIVALDRKPSFTQRVQLLSAQVNVLDQDVRGFLLMNAETLSVREEYRLINVRRLLILIRRLAQIEGQQYVFEPNSGSFRDRVQHQFEGFMSDMFLRGAFSGASPQQAFRVITDRSVNTESRNDRGQFIIELQIAPSRPMAFLTVRLVQSGLNELAVQEL